MLDDDSLLNIFHLYRPAFTFTDKDKDENYDKHDSSSTNSDHEHYPLSLVIDSEIAASLQKSKREFPRPQAT